MIPRRRALSLRGSTLEIAQQMQKEIQERLAKAGVEVIERTSATWRIHRRLPARCFAVSRLARWSRPAKDC